MLARVRVRYGGGRGSPGHLVDIAAPRRGGRLDTGGGVDAIAYDETFFGRLCRGGAAGDDPYPGLQVRRVLRAVGGDGRYELESCSDGSFGVVLLRHRCAPYRHDRVADELLDDAAVSGDYGPGELEVTRQELSYLLGVSFLRQWREADEVAEQHRDMAELGALARARRLERGIRGSFK